MPQVRNLPPEPDFRNWLRHEAQTILVLCLWGVIVLCLSILLAGRPADRGWTLLTSIDWTTVATPMTDEAACRAMLVGEEQTCVPGDVMLISP